MENIVDLRINETRQTGAVENRTYRVEANAVRLETEPTRGASVPLFFKFTIFVGWAWSRSLPGL